MSHPLSSAEPEGGADVTTEEWRPYEETQPANEHSTALPVRVVKDPTQVESQAADHSSFQTYALLGPEAPFQLLAFDVKRSKATIIVQGAGQTVRLAKQEQVSNNGGAVIPGGTTVPYSAAPAIWCIPQSVNGAVTISVVEERYA